MTQRTESDADEVDAVAEGRLVSWPEALRTWTKVGLNSFGGPAGQIAVMHRILVEEKRWISEERFLHALNYCMLLPGPEAMQLATYVGWLMHRTLGGLIAGTFFVLPGFISILTLSVLYARFQEVALVTGLFFGLRPAVLAIVIQAVLRLGRRVLKNSTMIAIALAAFVAIFFFNVPFPLIVISAAAVGIMGERIAPDRFYVIREHSGGAQKDGRVDIALDAQILDHTRPTTARTMRTIAIWLAIWFLPVWLVFAIDGADSIYLQQIVFFSKAAVVTFGGAYSVLAYVAQRAVETYGWLMPGEMLDGLGMAETTPGPLIQCVQFVGFMGAFREPGDLSPIGGGLLASVLVTWVTFVPCFLWIFAGAPYIEALRGRRSLSCALSAITAAVVGVVLNLSVWFALHTSFAEVSEVHAFGARLLIPQWGTIRWASVLLAVFAMVLIFRFRLGMIPTIVVCTLIGMGYHTLFT